MLLGITKCGCTVEWAPEGPDAKHIQAQYHAKGLKGKRQALSTFDKSVRGCRLCLNYRNCDQNPAPLFADGEDSA